MHQHLSRRDIIKTILVTSASSLIANKAWAAKVVSEVTANAIDPTVGIARIQLSSFAALATNGGSVRLGSSALTTTPAGDVFPVGIFYPVVINRVSATEYVALESSCLHAGCVVGALSGGLNGRMNCPCHGSQYDIHGKCTFGPAGVGQFLRSYPTTISNGILVIQLGDQGFNMVQQKVLNGTEERLQLSWDSFSGTEYELRYRPNFATEPVKVNFSTSLSGAQTTAFVTGNDTAATDATAKKIFVVPQDGIYQVAIRMRAV